MFPPENPPSLGENTITAKVCRIAFFNAQYVKVAEDHTGCQNTKLKIQFTGAHQNWTIED